MQLMLYASYSYDLVVFTTIFGSKRGIISSYSSDQCGKTQIQRPGPTPATGGGGELPLLAL